VYVCNVATERGETDSFSVSDHYAALEQHVHDKLFTYVVANNNISANGSSNGASAQGVEPVRVDRNGVGDALVVAADVVSEVNRYYHDTTKLASLLMGLYYQRRVDDSTAATAVEPQEAAAL